MGNFLLKQDTKNKKQRLLELKAKIKNKEYLSFVADKIATDLCLLLFK